MKVRPLHDRVLIKRIEEQETVRGGIIIPDTAKEKPQEGEVVAVGTGKTLENGSIVPLEVKAGRPGTFRKVFRNRNQAGGSGLSDLTRRRNCWNFDAAPAKQPARNRRNTNGRNRLFMVKIHGRQSCAASTYLPMQSRSRSVPRAAMWFSTRNSARR